MALHVGLHITLNLPQINMNWGPTFLIIFQPCLAVTLSLPDAKLSLAFRSKINTYQRTSGIVYMISFCI